MQLVGRQQRVPPGPAAAAFWWAVLEPLRVGMVAGEIPARVWFESSMKQTARSFRTSVG